MVLAITVLHDLTQIKHLHCEVRIAEVADLFEVIKATAFLGSKRRSGESQVNHTAVKSDIASRQILTADNDSRRNDGLSRLSVAVHILLRLTCAAPKSLQIGDFTLVKVVFVLIKNHHSVRYLRNTVVHRRYRGDADARRVHAVDKERLQGSGERGFACAFQSEQIKKRKAVLNRIDNITEHRGKEEAKPDFAVVAEHINHLLSEVVKRDCTASLVLEHTFKLENSRVLAIHNRCSRDIVFVSVINSDDAKVIDSQERSVFENAVAPGIKLIYRVPAHLLDE